MNVGSSGEVVWLGHPLLNFLSGCLRGPLGSLIPSEGTGSAFMSHKMNICVSREIGIIWLRKRGTASRAGSPRLPNPGNLGRIRTPVTLLAPGGDPWSSVLRGRAHSGLPLGGKEAAPWVSEPRSSRNFAKSGQWKLWKTALV